MTALARHRFTASRSTLRRCLADAEQRAVLAERAAADATARAERAETVLGVLQGRYEDLQDRQQQLVTELAALRSKLMRSWFEEAQDTCKVPAPADDPESAWWDGGATQETSVVALWDAIGTRETARETPAIGPVTPVEPIPPLVDGGES